MNTKEQQAQLHRYRGAAPDKHVEQRAQGGPLQLHDVDGGRQWSCIRSGKIQDKGGSNQCSLLHTRRHTDTAQPSSGSFPAPVYPSTSHAHKPRSRTSQPGSLLADSGTCLWRRRVVRGRTGVRHDKRGGARGLVLQLHAALSALRARRYDRHLDKLVGKHFSDLGKVPRRVTGP